MRCDTGVSLLVGSSRSLACGPVLARGGGALGGVLGGAATLAGCMHSDPSQSSSSSWLDTVEGILWAAEEQCQGRLLDTMGCVLSL